MFGNIVKKCYGDPELVVRSGLQIQGCFTAQVFDSPSVAPFSKVAFLRLSFQNGSILLYSRCSMFRNSQSKPFKLFQEPKEVTIVKVNPILRRFY
jgi:hypothetical protein